MLFGIDALGLKQKCLGSKNIEWDRGKCSKVFLEGMLEISEIQCAPAGNDTYKRIVAVCSANDMEINKQVVWVGYGLAYKQYSKKYTEDEDYTRKHKVSILPGQFTIPEEFRIQQLIRKDIVIHPD